MSVKVAVKNDAALTPGAKANLKRLNFSYRTSSYEHSISVNQGVNDLIDNESGGVEAAGASMTAPLSNFETTDMQLEIKQSVRGLIDHLNEHIEYYHRLIWWNMDRDRLFMILDGFYVPGTPLSIASVVERDPIAIAGNSLVFRVAAGGFLGSNDIPPPDDLFNMYNSRRPVSPPMHISLPTDGVYAQAALDPCSTIEEHYGSTDWPLLQSDPEVGVVEPSLLESRRAEPTNLTPTPLPATIINLQNAAPAPAPQGLGGVLGAVQNHNTFRDMAGLEGTQALTKSSLDAATILATTFGNQAAAIKLADLADKKQAVDDADRKMASIQRAKDKGLISDAEAEKQASQTLQDMSSTTIRQPPHLDPVLQEAIKAAQSSAGTKIEASTPEGTIKIASSSDSTELNLNELRKLARPRSDLINFQASPSVISALSDRSIDIQGIANAKGRLDYGLLRRQDHKIALS